MLGAICGAAFGFGCWQIFRAIFDYRPLHAVLNTKKRARPALSSAISQPKAFFSECVSDSLFVESLGDGFRSDLRICGKTPEGFLLDLSSKLLGVFVVVAVCYLSGIHPGFIYGSRFLALFVAAVLLVAFISAKEIRDKAERLRSEMLEAVATYIEFIRLSAQTRPIEGAMASAATAGTSWPFQAIQHSYQVASKRNQTMSFALGELGKSYLVPELIELGASLELARQEGTPVEAALAAKSTSLRNRLVQQELAEAQSRTEQLTIPMTGIGVCLFVLIIAPAILAF